MGDRTVGLIEKYQVSRTDGKPIEHGCIVLEWDDPNARRGIDAFAKAVREMGYIQLADDLDDRLGEWAWATETNPFTARCHFGRVRTGEAPHQCRCAHEVTVYASVTGKRCCCCGGPTGG